MRFCIHFTLLIGLSSLETGFAAGVRVEAPSGTGVKLAKPTLAARPIDLHAACCRPEALVVQRSTTSVLAWLAEDVPLGELPSTTKTQAAETGASEEVPPLPPRIDFGPASAELPTDELARHWLIRWSEASRSLESICPAQERRMVRQWRGQHNGHEIAALTVLQGPVNRETLISDYEWKAETSSEGVRLVATPRDPLDRLFFSHLELTLSSKTALPLQVRFFDRQGQPNSESIAMAQPRRLPLEEPGRLQVVARKLPLPVSAVRGPVRTAGGEGFVLEDPFEIGDGQPGPIVVANAEMTTETDDLRWERVWTATRGALTHWVFRAGYEVHKTVEQLYRPIDAPAWNRRSPN